MDGRPDAAPVLTSTGSAGWGPLVFVALVVGGILLALVKPWDGPPDSSPSAAGPTTEHGPRRATSGSATGPPTPAPATPSPEQALAADCLAPPDWRVFTTERWLGGSVRAWTAVRPVAASGPEDPTIPILPVIAVAVTGLGYCAPVTGAGRPAATGLVRQWRLDGGRARPLAPATMRPDRPTILGALYRPPVGAVSARPPGGWADGRYVFDVDGRWFGVEIRLMDGL